MSGGALGVRAQVEAGYVRFATAGATFAPVVELAGGSAATVTWTVEGTGLTATGLTPTLDWGSALPRHVRMSATRADGSDGLADVIMINLGYLHTDDVGRYVMGAGYDKTAQLVTGVENVHLCTGLIRFAAANIVGLVGELSFRGLSHLEYIECAYSRVQSVDLTGCTSLIRLCLEQNDLTYLDLNPVAANLYDLRAAAQYRGTLTFETLTAALAVTYHFCVRDQTVVGLPLSRLTAVEELYIWNTGQTGTLTIVSTAITSLQAALNGYSAVVITGISTLTAIDLHGNTSLNQADVDGILVEVESWNTSSGAITLASTAVPSATGLAARTDLLARSWTVTVDSASGPLWEDDFERTDATGLTAVGNGWFALAAGNADIVSGDLVRTDTGAYRGVLALAGGALPADYTVTVTLPGTSITAYLGVVGRWANGNSNGVAAFFGSAAAAFSDLHLCEAGGFMQGEVTLTADSAFPASWANSGIDHTFALRMLGTTCTIILDGTTVGHGTVTVNAAVTGTAVGMVGEGAARHIRSITVT